MILGLTLVLVFATFRLAIARGVYQNPSVLILDEATSALDSRSELLVRQAVHRLMENRTVSTIIVELIYSALQFCLFLLKSHGPQLRKYNTV